MSGKRHPPGSKFRLYAAVLDGDGNVDVSASGWIGSDPHVGIVKSVHDAIVFTSGKTGSGSTKDWIKFFESDNPEWNVSVSWVEEESPVRR